MSFLEDPPEFDAMDAIEWLSRYDEALPLNVAGAAPAEINAAEAAAGVRFPTDLRAFLMAVGLRADWTLREAGDINLADMTAYFKARPWFGEFARRERLIYLGHARMDADPLLFLRLGMTPDTPGDVMWTLPFNADSFAAVRRIGSGIAFGSLTEMMCLPAFRREEIDAAPIRHRLTGAQIGRDQLPAAAEAALALGFEAEPFSSAVGAAFSRGDARLLLQERTWPLTAHVAGQEGDCIEIANALRAAVEIADT
jgi:hypothetical protein